MRILTFIKHVPASAATPRVGEGGGIDEGDLAYEANEPDLYAVEEGIHQASLHQGEVTAVTIGPERARDVLHVALAKGAKSVLHVVDEVNRGTNAAVNLAAAVHAVGRVAPDLILCGVQAEDDMQGQFGASLAERLGMPVISAVTEVNIDPAGHEATIVREMGAGFREELRVTLPCVLTIQFGIRPLRYTSIMSIVKMKRHPVEAIDVGTIEAPQETPAAMRIVSLSTPESRAQCEMIAGTPQEAAEQLMRKLLDRGALTNA